jgi:hypothetical protein
MNKIHFISIDERTPPEKIIENEHKIFTTFEEGYSQYKTTKSIVEVTDSELSQKISELMNLAYREGAKDIISILKDDCLID